MKNKNNNELSVFEEEFGLTVNEEGNVVTNSLKVAEYYGKDHADVLKKIRKFIDLIPELGQGNFSETYFTDKWNRKQPMFAMDRQGFSMLVNKFTGDDATIFTYKYTKAFEAMIEELEHRREQSLNTIKALNEKDEKIQRKKMLDSYFGKRKTVTTFKYCGYEEFTNILNLFDEYLLQIREAEDKRVEYDRLVYGLTQNRNSIPSTDKMFMLKTTAYSYYIQEFTKKKGSSDNKSNGQKLRHKNGIISKQAEIINEKDEALNSLENKLNYYEPEDYEWIELKVHPFSHNYMTTAAKDWNTGNPKIVKSEGYYKWQNKFPYQQLPVFEELGIDFSKRVCAWFRFVAKSTFDPTNCSKTALDTICKHYGVDDNKIEMMECKKIDTCKEFWDGKIYVAFRNQ